MFKYLPDGSNLTWGKNLSILIGWIKTIKYLNSKVIVFAKQLNKIKIIASDRLTSSFSSANQMLN